MAQDTRKTTRAEGDFRFCDSALTSNLKGFNKPVSNEDLADAFGILADDLAFMARGLQKCAGALRDIYECVSRIEANQKKGTPIGAAGGSARLPSRP
jgi:hypothetical protein